MTIRLRLPALVVAGSMALTSAVLTSPAIAHAAPRPGNAPAAVHATGGLRNVLDGILAAGRSAGSKPASSTQEPGTGLVIRNGNVTLDSHIEPGGLVDLFLHIINSLGVTGAAVNLPPTGLVPGLSVAAGATGEVSADANVASCDAGFVCLWNEPNFQGTRFPLYALDCITGALGRSAINRESYPIVFTDGGCRSNGESGLNEVSTTTGNVIFTLAPGASVADVSAKSVGTA